MTLLIEKISELISDVFDGPRQVNFKPGGISYVHLGGLQLWEIYPDSTKQIDPQNLDSRFILDPEDILLSKTGQEPRAALVSSDIAGATFSPDIYCLRLKTNRVSPAWLTYYFNSSPISEILAKQYYGKTTPRLHISELRQFPIVVPPSELLQEVDQLEVLAQQHNQAAHEIWTATLKGLNAEIDGRLGLATKVTQPNSENSKHTLATNLTDDELMMLLDMPREGISFSFLSQIAQIAVSSRKSFQPDQTVHYVQASDIDPNSFLFRRMRSGKVKDLPARIRLPIQAYQVLLLASGSNLGTSHHPVGIVEPQLDGCLASNTFLALEFHDTPIYYGMVLKHPVVLAQIRRLAAGEVVSILRKKDVAHLKIPMLGSIWRQDFNDRAQLAWERRTLALKLRRQAMAKAEAYIKQNLAGAVA